MAASCPAAGRLNEMQVARLLEPRQKRSVNAKIRQVVRAIELEWGVSKAEILAFIWPSRPMAGRGGAARGLFTYFGKEPRG